MASAYLETTSFWKPNNLKSAPVRHSQDFKDDEMTLFWPLDAKDLSLLPFVPHAVYPL